MIRIGYSIEDGCREDGNRELLTGCNERKHEKKYLVGALMNRKSSVTIPRKIVQQHFLPRHDPDIHKPNLTP